MKKRFTILIAALMLLTMISQPTRLWGQEKTDNKVYTLAITKNTSNTGYANYYDIEVSSIGWKAPGNQSLGAYIKIGGKLSSATDRYLYSKTAISGNINKVIVTHGTKDSQITVNSMTLKVYSTAADAADDKDPIATISGTYADGGSTTFTKPNNDDWSGCFYRINYNLSSSASSKNYGIIFTKAEFYTTTFTLTYSATNGDISGVLYGTTTTVSSGGSVNKGGKVTLTADPESGYSFYRWSVSGDNSTLSSTSDNPTTFTMGTANATVTATFVSAGNYINVSPTTATPSCAAQNVAFSVDTDQTLDANPVVFYTTLTGDVTASKPSWIGDLTSAYSSSTLTIPVAANTGAARTAYFRVEKGIVKSDVITINQAVYAPSAPTLPAAGNFDYTKEITITVPDGTTVYYTLDGSNPTSSSTPYSAPFTISAAGSTTVKAIAYDNGYPSDVVSATYTRTYHYISDITKAGSYKVKGTVVAVNETYGFVIGDGTGYIYDYKSSHDLSTGNKVEVNGSVTTYNFSYQYNSVTPTTVLISNYTTGTPEITALTGSIYDSYCGSGAMNLNTYFEVVGAFSTTNKEITIAGTSKKVRLYTSIDCSSFDGKTVKVKGYFIGFDKNSSPTYMKICPESVEAVPVLTTSVSSISDFTYNVGGGPDAKSFTVSGANLTDDITVSTNSVNFEISSDNSNWQTSDITISKGNGTVSATTIYVRLKSGLSSNTYSGKITVSSDGADDKEIALTGTVKHTITISNSIANGTVSSDPSDAAVAGATVTLTAEPESSSYVLNSFTVTKAGGGTVSVEDGEFTMPSDNVTVSATFDHVYHVYYNANGGTGTLTDSNNYTTGDKAKVKANSFVKDGYTFHHWDTKDDDTGTDYNPNDDITIGTADVTLYAQWSVKSYNVALSSVANVDLLASYSSSSTIAEGKNADVPYGTEITLSASNMDAGKVFIWAITDEYENDVTDDVLDGDVLTVPAYNITIGGQVAELYFKYSGDISEGDYIIANGNNAMKNTLNSKRFNRQSISPSNNQIIVADASAYLWHIASSGDYWTIYNAAEEKYAVGTGKASEIDLGGNSDDKCLFSISGTTTYTFVSKYNTDQSVNATLRDGGTYWACYGNGTANTLYKKAVGSKHTVAIADGITYGNPSASPSMAYEGQTVALTPNPSSGYMLESWDVYKTGETSTKITVKNNSFVMPGYDVTVSATYRVQHTYTLVDGSTVTLVPGKHYIIASTNSTNYYVMGAQNDNVRSSVPATLSGSKILEHTDFYEVVISGSGSSSEPYTIYSVRDEGYMYSTGASKANIGTRTDNVTTNPTYGQWTISISTGTATITSKAGTGYTDLEYNHNGGSNPRFACYSSGQTAVKLYVRDGDKDLEFHSPTTIASATIAADETYTVEKNQTLTITTLSNKGDEDNLIIEDGGQLITSSTGVKATVKKEIEKSTATKSGEGWYTIASSVSTPAITSGTNLADGTYDLYRFNETEQSTPWENYKAHSSSDFTTLENGRGYLYRNGAKKTLTFAGALNVGEVDYAVTNSGGTLAGINLVGNPYSYNITLGGNTSLLDKDKNALDAESQLTACYTLTNAGGWEPGQLDDDDPIKPSQGFLIEVPEDAKTIRFSKGAKKDRANNEYIKFIVENSEYSDATYALFDKGLGLSKIDHRNSAIPMIYIPQGKEDYAVAIMNDNTEAFGLNVKVATTGLYTLKYKTKGEFSYLHVIDRLTGEDVDMLLNGEYSFFSSTQDDYARFIVRLAYKPNYGNDNESVFAYQSGSEIFVSGEGELQVFDVLGRFVMSERINGVKTVSVPAQGVYVFRLVGENVKTQKIVVR